MTTRLTCSFRSILLTAGLVAFTALTCSAQNAPANLFQLDGNAAQSNNYPACSYGPCDNWNLLNGSPLATPPIAGSNGSSTVKTFINGLASTASFTGGGSKDPNDLNQWAYSTSPTPNKDTLNAGYAAAYSAPNGDFEVIFGANRASPNGDANIGIWFFQQNVGPNGNGGFTGLHTNGDIFVISAFTGGGGTASVSVYAWDSTCASGVKNPLDGQCSDTHLRLLGSAAAASVCGSSPFCAITNTNPTMSSWQGTLQPPLFFEGGVDITQALALAKLSTLPCFSSFLEETRSSQSTTAVLKDFVSGGFPVCGLSITKACDYTNTKLINNGSQVHFAWTGTVTNTGIGTLDGVQVTDTLPDGTTPTLSLTDVNGVAISSLGPHQIGNYAVTYNSSNLTETNKATAQGQFGSTMFTSDLSHPATATCTQPVNTALTITKACVAPGPGLSCGTGGCVVQVPVKAVVCNAGNVQVSGITLGDSPAATISPNGFSLNPGQCTGDGSAGAPAIPAGSYQPTSATGDGATNGRYTFSDTISITGAKAVLGSLNPISAGLCSGTFGCSAASCPLCNGGECTTTPLQ